MQQPIFLLLGIALLALSVLSSPTPRNKYPGSFKVEHVRRSSEFAVDGPAALKKAYAKFGILPTGVHFDTLDFEPSPKGSSREAISKAVEPDENGAVTNNPTHNDVQFLSPVTIGGQKFVMNFDTGSSDSWVFNTQLDKVVSDGHSVFDPAKSKTFSELEGHTFNITYGDRSFAFGSVGIDTVDIGGATVDKQAIGLPTDVAPSFAEDDVSDGLIGLGFTKLNTMEPTQQKTFFENIADDLDEPVFTAQLKHGAVGSYEFGAIDKAKYTDDLVKIPVDNSKGFWEFKSTMFAVKDQTKIQRVRQGGSSAIADTGTTLMLINKEIAEAYYEQVQGSRFSFQAGGFIYPCNATLPDLFVSVADTHLARIPGSLINFAVVGVSFRTKSQMCLGGVQSNQGSGIQVYGDVFFKALFVVFDLRGPSLHLAPHA